MAKKQWNEIEFGKILGMATNVVNPGLQYPQRLNNVKTNEKMGSTRLREGYSLKYSPPFDSTITNSSFLTFETFNDYKANPAGQEITCLIQKGTINAIGNVPIVSTTQNALCFWIRPYWDGTSWIDDWQWLNKIIITNISQGYNIPYSNLVWLFGGSTSEMGNNALTGWTIYNVTKNQYAKVITSVVDSPGIRITHTLFNSNWNATDVIILMKNYYDLISLAAIYNVNWYEIVFHKINDDLRIGFGGRGNRTGVSIGYRSKTFLLNNFNFPAIYPDLTPTALQAFATINQVVLDEFIANNTAYGFEIGIIAGSLTSNTYYFRMTAKLDGYEEQLVYDDKIQLNGAQDVQIIPYIILGQNNSRLTSLCVYQSVDGITFYKFNEFILTYDSLTSPVWSINSNSKFILNVVASIILNPELYTEANAACIANEINSVGSWTLKPAWVNGDTLGTISTDNIGADGSSYSLKFSGGYVLEGMKFPLSGLRIGGKYQISIWLKADLTDGGPTRLLQVVIYDNNLISNISTYLKVPGTFTKYTFILDTTLMSGAPYYFAVTFGDSGLNRNYWIDQISIKSSDAINYNLTIANGPEMSNSMGYTPTYNLVKAWDHAIKFSGRMYFLNPYIDKRYDDFIYVSIINAGNSFLWDIASAANYRNLEKLDGNKSIGIVLLANNQILVIRDKSVMSIDPDTGISSEPRFGNSCVSLQSIVDFGDMPMWCGLDDIYYLDLSSGIIGRGILEKTIRDLYLQIVDKTNLFAFADDYHSYRLRTFDKVNNTEYLLTKNGVNEESKYDFPMVTRRGINSSIYFLSSDGSIYLMDPIVTITPIVVVNWNFNLPTGWAFDPNVWTINAGKATATGAGPGQNISQVIPAQIGKAYVIIYTILDISGPISASITVSLGSNSGTRRTAAGTYVEKIICAGNNTLSFLPENSLYALTNVDIKNIHVYQID